MMQNTQAADVMITQFIECQLSEEPFPSLDYSTEELRQASRRAGCRDLNGIMHELDRIIAGRQ
jgi:hypothetical protein